MGHRSGIQSCGADHADAAAEFFEAAVVQSEADLGEDARAVAADRSGEFVRDVARFGEALDRTPAPP